MTPVHAARTGRALTVLAALLALAGATVLAGRARPAEAPRVVLVTNNCDAQNFVCPGFLAALRRTGVAGKVISPDPREDPDARLIPRLTYMEAIEQGLKVMDTTALTLCMDNDLPILVFNMGDERNVVRILSGERVGTVVSNQQGE